MASSVFYSGIAIVISSWKRKKKVFLYTIRSSNFVSQENWWHRSFAVRVLHYSYSHEYRGESLLLAIEQDGRQLLCNNESKFEKF